MRACERVHDKLSCTSLQNYTIVYTNIAAVTKFIAKNNKITTGTSASKTTIFVDFMFTNYMYRFTKKYDRRILALIIAMRYLCTAIEFSYLFSGDSVCIAYCVYYLQHQTK